MFCLIPAAAQLINSLSADCAWSLRKLSHSVMDCFVFVAKIGIFVSDYKSCVRKSGDVLKLAFWGLIDSSWRLLLNKKARLPE